MPRKKTTSSNLPKSDTAELEQRSRQLSAKESELTQWEQQLNSRQGLEAQAKVQVALLEAKQAKVEAEIVRLGRELQVKSDANEAEVKFQRRVADEASVAASKAKAESAKAIESLAAVSGKAVVAQKLLKEVEQEIKDRKLYLLEQEELIEKSADDGNNKLQDIGREFKKFELEREELLVKLHADTTSVSKLETQIEAKEEDLVRLELRYTDAANDYRQKLAAIKLEIAEAEGRAKKANEDADGKLLELKAERAEIEIARGVIAQQRQDLADERRRLDSKRSMYEVQ